MSTRLSAVERKGQLLAVALDVFARQGFHGTSMNEVADAAGVTKPVLYQHFPSKRHLYRELLAEVGGRLQDSIAKATRDAATPREMVERGMVAYFRWVANDRDQFRLLFGGGARRDEEFAKDVQRVEASIAQTIAELIQADIDPEHRRVLAYGIVGLAEGCIRQLVHTETEFDPDMLARQIADMAWAGLRGVHRIDG